MSGTLVGVTVVISLYRTPLDAGYQQMVRSMIWAGLPQGSRFFWKKGKRVNDFYPLTLVIFLLPFYPFFSLTRGYPLTLFMQKNLGVSQDLVFFWYHSLPLHPLGFSNLPFFGPGYDLPFFTLNNAGNGPFDYAVVTSLTIASYFETNLK